jgi:ribosomal-protein-alanine N-acetyltransferase
MDGRGYDTIGNFPEALMGHVPMDGDAHEMTEAERLIVESASWRDLSAVHQLSRLCFGRDAWPWLDLLAALTAPGTIRRIVRDEGEVVGYVLGDRRGGGMGWISSIAVHPDYRRRGLASRLLREVEARLATERIRLTLRRSNQAALALYYKHGYREADVWPRYYRDGEDGLVMERTRVEEAG